MFCSGGALWFSDLSVADPYYTLPVRPSALKLLLEVRVLIVFSAQATAIGITLINLERMKQSVTQGVKAGEPLPL